jgi:signal transduction histidine kinase
MRSRSLWDDVIKLPPLDDNQTQEDTLTVTDREIKTVQLLVRTITPEENPNQKWTLIMAGSSRELEKSLDELAIRLSLFLVLLFVSLSIAAIAQVILSLSPLRSLQNEMKKLRTTPMIRLKGNFPQEVQPLIDEFNLALDQNEQVIARARAQTGDLAHALKTPLAVLSNAARNDLLQPNRDHKMSELVSEQVTVMQRHIDWRLKRARTATTQDARHGQIEIAPVMTQLVHVMQRIHQQRSIEILTVFSPENVSFHGEIQDLQEMLGNILDNAFKWAYSKITIQATMENKGLKIVVADDGPGLPAQQCQRVIERGFRADEQTPGSGLGLSIVQELVGLYQGRMELDLNEPEGLRITLRF